jgi:HK97 family phage portal protein
MHTTLKLAHVQMDQAGDVAVAGIPSAVLKSDNPDLTAAEARTIKAKWMEARRDRSPAVLNSTTSFEPLAWNPEEMQMLQARQFTNGEISMIYGVDAAALNAQQQGAHLTYSNIEQKSIERIRENAGGHIARFEHELSRHMPRGTRVKANLDSRLRADTKTRYEAHQIGIASGFLLKNEARALEDLPPIDGLDDPQAPIQATATVGAPMPDVAMPAIGPGAEPDLNPNP